MVGHQQQGVLFSRLADLAEALRNWDDSNNGRRSGRGWVSHVQIRSPRSRPARFSTGTMRLEDDRRTITLPVIGGLRAKENTRSVQRHVASGRHTC